MVIAGSIRAARSAGIQHAPIPIAAIITATPTNVAGSCGATPKSSPRMTRAVFHRPEELLRLVAQDQQLRHRLRHLPVLVTGKLWPVQAEAIGNLERSLAANRLTRSMLVRLRAASWSEKWCDGCTHEAPVSCGR